MGNRMSFTLCLSFVISTVHCDDSKPNIVFILADDLGWGNVGFHNDQDELINTPNIDSLATSGLILSRHYVYSGCSPSRSAFQSGRLPVHVTMLNNDGLDRPSHGVPAKMTSVASKLKMADYSTFMVGKWDAGFASYDQIPTNKGYDYFYGYLSKANGYFDKMGMDICQDDVDLWSNGQPAYNSVEEMDQEEFVEFDFRDRTLDLLDQIKENDDGNPFFLMYSSHLPHFPLNIPKEYLLEDVHDDDEDQCSTYTDFIYPGGETDKKAFKCRTILQSQVNLLDLVVGQIVDKLKANGLWDNTLLVFSTDNGGAIQLSETAGNNYPLRGGKNTDFEGGIRATAFVNGGYLPDSRRGQTEDGVMHLADWYATFASIAGVDPADDVAVADGLPDIDALNLWPLLSGESDESPRVELPISGNTLIMGDYKLIVGTQRYAVWQEAVWPHGDLEDDELKHTELECSVESPCLFDVAMDPMEFTDISDQRPDLVDAMSLRMQELWDGFYENDRMGEDSCPSVYNEEMDPFGDPLSCGCWMAQHNYNWFIGPYQDLTEEQKVFLLPDHVVPEHPARPVGVEPKPPNNFQDEVEREENEKREEKGEGEELDHPPKQLKEKALSSSLQSRNPFRSGDGKGDGSTTNDNLDTISRPATYMIYGTVITILLIAALFKSCRVERKQPVNVEDDNHGSYVQIH